MISLTVNGVAHSYDGDGDMPLLWYLRDELGLLGTKFGCGQALCGSCTVHLDAAAIRSCQTPMTAVANAKLVTIEGLSPNGMHTLQIAWRDLQVPQCGYCQAGQIMQAAALLASMQAPSDRDIDDAMAGNICRCGTYGRIRAAIRQAAQGGKS